jgi:GNAT superfamily N-acetyltransferase
VSIELRPAEDSDLEWIVEVRAVVLREDLERLGRFDPVRVRQRMRDGFSKNNTRVIVVDGKDVGSVSVRHEPEERWLEHFYIIPDQQGNGIGSRVLESVLREPGETPLRLNVLNGSSARRLYERHGFVVDTEDDVDVFMTRQAVAR